MKCSDSERERNVHIIFNILLVPFTTCESCLAPWICNRMLSRLVPKLMYRLNSQFLHLYNLRSKIFFYPRCKARQTIVNVEISIKLPSKLTILLSDVSLLFANSCTSKYSCNMLKKREFLHFLEVSSRLVGPCGSFSW